MTKSALDSLFAHMAWADRRILGLLEDDAAPDGRAVDLLAHVLAAERIWLDRLQGNHDASVEVWPELSVEDCRHLLASNEEDYRQFLNDLDDEKLARRTHYRNSRGAEFETAVADILMHVALHGTYHRAQIAMVIRQGGREPVNTDFITYVREDPRR